jgi:glutamate-1-semialdehyde 2,1-aminomutase
MASEIVVREGRAARIWDEDGNEYVDYALGSGPMLVGHAHPDVTAAAQEQTARGTTFFANNRHGILLAEEIVAAVACAEQVRFVSSGTEADVYAMRLARAFSGKDKILKFEGGYHGMSDYSLMSLAPRRQSPFPTPVPDSPGIPRSVEGEMLIAPFNDLETVTRLVQAHKHELGGVIVEPFQRLLRPVPGFLEGLRKLTLDHGIPLIFDEVVTGFRLAYGGAQELYGVVPDICTLGKACGGGFPLAAVAGRADIMARFDRNLAGEEKFLTQIGTLSGNPVAAAAGLATLKILKQPGVYERLFATGRELMDNLAEQMRRAGIAAQVVGIAPVFEVVFATGEMRNYRDLQRGDAGLARRFNALLRKRGIFKTDSKYYVSLAHTREDVEFTKQAWTSAIEELARSAETQAA